MNRNSFKYIAMMLALSAIVGGIAVATVVSAAPANAGATQEEKTDSSIADDESSDRGAVEDQTGVNTLEDMLLFQGPLATLWAAPESVTASVQWREVTEPGEKTEEATKADAGASEE